MSRARSSLCTPRAGALEECRAAGLGEAAPERPEQPLSHVAAERLVAERAQALGEVFLQLGRRGAARPPARILANVSESGMRRLAGAQITQRGREPPAGVVRVAIADRVR